MQSQTPLSSVLIARESTDNMEHLQHSETNFFAVAKNLYAAVVKDNNKQRKT
jgi:hypothetical protein